MTLIAIIESVCAPVAVVLTRVSAVSATPLALKRRATLLGVPSWLLLVR